MHYIVGVLVGVVLGYAFRGREHAAIVKAVIEAQKIPGVGRFLGTTSSSLPQAKK